METAVNVLGMAEITKCTTHMTQMVHDILNDRQQQKGEGSTESHIPRQMFGSVPESAEKKKG